MSSRTLIIRADASVAIGTGHVIRCLALAQALQDRGGDAIFAMAQSTPPLDEYLRSEHVELLNLEATPGSEEDAIQLVQMAQTRAAEWIVVDGYQFKSAYQRVIKQAGLKLLLVDDTGESGPYCADIILNQNITAREEMYAAREPETKMLLGSSYVLLRREFERWREWTRNSSITAQSVLVAMGGTDPDALTLKVVRAFAKVHNTGLQVKVIVGGSNPCIADLQRAAKELGSQIQLLTDVRDMAAAMAECDLALICGGGTLWEALYMGCATTSYSRPGVQRQINERVGAAGAIFDLGPVEDFNENELRSAMQKLVSSARLRDSMAQTGRKLVDGNGASRVIGILCGSAPTIGSLKMEPINASQRDEFLQMAMRHFRELNPAFTPHADWNASYFENIQKRADHYSLRWIVKDDQCVGFILFGVESHRFLPRRTGVIWELYVLPEARRKGVARECALLAIQEMSKLSPSKIRLEVVHGNEAAVALWESLGFEKTAESFAISMPPDSWK